MADMQDEVRKLIEAGLLPDDEAAVEAIRRVPMAVYAELHADQMKSFTFLAKLPLQSSLAFIRALALAEKIRLCRYPGSVSLLIPAFNACRLRSKEDVAIIADWIVVNHDNPWTPFCFRRTREYWEEARQSSASPIETLHRVREMESEEATARNARAKKHEVRESISRLNKGRVPDSAQLRERMIQEMERRILDS